ncbi:cytochrome P450 family protein [Mycolicibacterium vaccae]|uniref:Steroid C26-monooxygenase n=1 Tax=Mycolicibacterium vaccae ATCC 25954 TaxID=1194972 RepID=K0VP03_MYCVA|nr:cytochrome P450 [Mycolicibacterium vaccae]ANI40902.1 cytochrome P450 [Mycolicibacterium vaccae 95051]EJZ12924.1 cytochrome P450 [Mycolicibacterium vaccae ATCC 25954]
MSVQREDEQYDRAVLTLGESFIQNPHATYARLRRQGPVHRVRLLNGAEAWLVTSYAEARSLLNDPRLKKNNVTASGLFPPGSTTIGSVLGDNMLFRDPPDHTRLRRFVSAAFTARSVRRLRPTIAGIADELLDAMAERSPGRVDLMQSLALPLPIRVIGELLGVPADTRFSSLVMPVFSTSSPEEMARAQTELTELLQTIIAAKREQQSDDVLGHLVHLRDHGDQLSEQELLGTAFLLITAGYETTVNLIANAVLALLRHPAQLAALREDRSLLPAAVEETLRYESPLNTATVRYTSAPVTVGGTQIPAGELVMIALLGANHDERQFRNADLFDIFRTDNRNLAFGHGIHHCIGAPLARMEAQIALDRLLSRFNHIELVQDEPLTYRPSTLMRGLVHLPVRVAAKRGPYRVR